jgi:ribosome maturation factor RimP
MALSEAWLQQVIDEEVEGVELIMLEQAGGKGNRVVRLYIDHEGGVTHELCGVVSEAVSAALDEESTLGGPYTLEVSSPGLERPLRKREHFESQLGKKVHVKTRVPVAGTKVHRGVLLEVSSEVVVIADGEQRTSIPLSEITTAHLIYEFE